MAVTVEMAVLAAPLVMLVPPQVDPQEPTEPLEPLVTEAAVVSAALLRTRYPVTVEPADRPLLATVATAEPVAHSRRPTPVPPRPAVLAATAARQRVAVAVTVAAVVQ